MARVRYFTLAFFIDKNQKLGKGGNHSYFTLISEFKQILGLNGKRF